MKALAGTLRATIGRLICRKFVLPFAVSGLVRGLLLTMAATTMVTARPSEQLMGLKGLAPEARLKLVGIAPMAGRSYAAIADAFLGLPNGQWMAVGGYLAGCYVKDISADAAVLTERQTGREFRLHLAGPAADEAGDAAERRKNWINSEDNPMYFAPFKLPAEVVSGWTNLSEVEKARVVAVWRDFGWNLVVVEPAGSSAQFGWNSIYKEQRNDAMARAGVEFENSLDPTQMVIFAKIKATWDKPASAGSPPASREKIEADNRVRQAEWPKLKATLNPIQQELYESMTNPIKAMRRTK